MDGGFGHACLGFERRHACLRGWFLALGYICPVAPNASALALLARILPAAFARRHPVHDTPQAGILFTGAFCLAAPWFGREALLWIVGMSAVG